MRISLNVDSVRDWKRVLTGSPVATFIWIDNDEDGDDPTIDDKANDTGGTIRAPENTERPFASPPVAWLAEAQDIIVTRHRVSPAFISYARKIQSYFPRIFPLGETRFGVSLGKAILTQPRMLAHLKAAADANTYLFPAYASRNVCAIAHLTGIAIAGNPRQDVFKDLNDKCYGRELTRSLGLPEIAGTACHSVGQLRRAVALAAELGHPILANGGDRVRSWASTPICTEEEAETFLRGFSDYSDEHIVSYVVESHLRKKRGFHYQFYTNANGAVPLSTAYRIMDAPDALREACRQTPMGLSAAQCHDILETASTVGRTLYQQGYRGIIGIDGIVDVDGTLYPVLDLNPRFTSVTLCTALIARLKPAFTYLETHFLTRLPYEPTFERISAVLSHLPALTQAEGGIVVVKVCATPIVDREKTASTFNGRVETLVVAATEARRRQLADGVAIALTRLQRGLMDNALSAL